MKNFISENWYKLMIGSSCMMFSFGVLIHSISPSYGNNPNINSVVIPLNEDGSLDIRLSDDPININIQEIDGYDVRTYERGVMKIKMY